MTKKDHRNRNDLRHFGSFKIQKEESSSVGVRRIKGILEAFPS